MFEERPREGDRKLLDKLCADKLASEYPPLYDVEEVSALVPKVRTDDLVQALKRLGRLGLVELGGEICGSGHPSSVRVSALGLETFLEDDVRYAALFERMVQVIEAGDTPHRLAEAHTVPVALSHHVLVVLEAAGIVQLDRMTSATGEYGGTMVRSVIRP